MSCQSLPVDAPFPGGQPFSTRLSSISLHDSKVFMEDVDGNMSAASKASSNHDIVPFNEEFMVDLNQSDDANLIHGTAFSDPVPSLEDPQRDLPTAKSKHHLSQPHTREIPPYKPVPSTRSIAKLREGHKPYKALSAKGQFQHYYVDPLFSWWGKNDRVILTQTLPTVDVQDRNGDTWSVVNGASHNYAGFYTISPESAELQRLCLEMLPFADATAVPSLEGAMHTAVSQHFAADFCYSTSTGYGSNLLALPAILDETWLVVMDEKSHNSMYTGTYLAQTSCVKKFEHNDMDQLETILEELAHKFMNVLVAIEGYYSMDGTIPPLDQLYRLKRQHKFTLYCDEAHSFLSTGKTGRGCLEYWNDECRSEPLPWDLIDIRTATLSKAVGGVGGIVCGSARFEKAVRKRVEHLNQRGEESLSSSTMVQTLYILGQPSRITHNLHRLRQMISFCRQELRRFGIHVYDNATTPVLSVYAGRPSWAAKLSYTLRQVGLLATPVTAPAVDFWESRVRVTLSADFNDSQVDKLLDCIVGATQIVGIIKKTNLQRILYRYGGADVDEECSENAACVSQIHELIFQDAANLRKHNIMPNRAFIKNCGTAVIKAGHTSRAKYGLGAGGSRWVTGTFPCHLQVEKLVACITQQEASMTFASAKIGLSSTVAALCRPLFGYSKHYLFMPAQVIESVHEGLRIAPKKDAPTVVEYKSLKRLFLLFGSLSSSKTYITLYMDTVLNKILLDFKYIISQLIHHKGSSGMTLLLNDFEGLGHHGPNRLGVAGTINLGEAASTLQARILVCGSFSRSFGLSGGYLTGDDVLIQELRYTCRNYMFSTSPQPFVMDMIKTALEKRIGEA